MLRLSTFKADALAAAVIPVVAVPVSGSSRALAAATVRHIAYDITLTANCLLTLTGGVVGQMQTITVFLRQDATAGRVVTLPSGVKWQGGVVPTTNTVAGRADSYSFTTPDGGVTWFGK